MAVNYTPNQNNYKDYETFSTFRMFVIENFPFINEDFDSMTYYQMLSKVVGYLKDTVENNIAIQENQTAVFNAYNELQGYVNDYFDNLDVQNEINIKLDLMAQDGTLTRLIKGYLEPYVNVQNQRINDINTKVTGALSGAPIPVDSNENMSDTNRIYVNTNDGNWYFYNGNEWVSGGIYQSTQIDNNSITPEKTNFMMISSMLNPDLCIEGKTPGAVGYCNDLSDDSKLFEGNGYCVSPCYSCETGEKYIHNANTYGNSLYLADETKKVIQTISIAKNTVWTVPAGVKYFRLCFAINSGDMNNGQWKNKVKLIKGDTLDETLFYGENGVKKLTLDNEQVDNLRDKILNNETIDKLRNEAFTDIIMVPEGTNYSDDKPIILLNFDGWNQNTFNIMAPYLKEKGLSFTLFFTGYNVANGINRNDLRNYMKEMGKKFEFALYTGQPSSTMLGNSNFEEQFEQIKNCYDGLVDYGIAKPKVCSYAGGSYTELTEYICKNSFGLKMGRSTENARITNNLATSFTIPCSAYGNDNVYTLQVVDSIVDNKQHRAVMTHNILSGDITDASYNISETYLKNWIDKIAEKVNEGKLTCMTFSEYYLHCILPHSAKIGQHAIVKENDSRYHEYVYTHDGWIETTNYKIYE